nr:hypothetical protein [Tanacetum cinerariifolium]
QTSAKRREMMPCPRFTKVIIYYFLSKHNSIPRRHGSRINCKKDDGVLGKLKFLSKGEPTQVYGMIIPNVMATVNPTKKGSITVEENILSNLDEALQLDYIMQQILKSQVKDMVLNQRFSMSQRSDDERTKSNEDDQETADAEKNDAKKADEEKGDKEKIRDDQAEKDQAKNVQAKDAQAEDDQTGTLISMTHKKKPEFPPSSSSLSSSSDYANQFLNVSSDVSLVGIIK